MTSRVIALHGEPAAPAAPAVPAPASCECTLLTGWNGCQSAAVWLVRVGARKADAQRSCGRHLDRTCRVLQAAELPRRAELMLTWIGT